MIEPKSDKLSIHHRTLGNKFFQNNQFNEALIEYNKALAYAESNLNVSLAYANRSAVYCEEENYKKCMQNIQWALENDYPPEKIEKLIERREKCERGLECYSMDPEEELTNFFQLSYPPNPKIPFIINDLQVRDSKKHGRGIFTTRDLKPGDIISIEKPVLASFVDRNGNYMFCCNCTVSKDNNLIPCLRTASLMFCSVKCRDEIYEKFTNFDCLISDKAEGWLARILYTYEDAFGGTENLKKFIKENNFKEWRKTIFDYDFSDANHADHKINAMKSILSCYAPLRYDTNRNHNSSAIKSVTKDKILRGFLEHMSVVWNTKVYFTVNNEGSKRFRFHLFSPLVNHSCFPNIDRVLSDSNTILYVSRPIKAGEEILRNVSGEEFLYKSISDRRNILERDNCLFCNCYYCENELTFDSLPVSQTPLHNESFFRFGFPKEMIKSMKKQFKDIEKYEALSPIGTQESYQIFINNKRKMNLMGTFLEYAY